MMKLMPFACVLAAEAKSYYRLEAPSTHLKVESCRDIKEGTFGDPEGTCAEHGFTEACVSCHGAMTFNVKDKGTCDQKHTECYFRAPTEECVGASECPHTINAGADVLAKSYYRLEAPSTHLKVESCRDIKEGTFGDPEGTCAEHGFTEACVSCHGAMTFNVKDKGTCDQKHTECYFRAPTEECVGASQCPHTIDANATVPVPADLFAGDGSTCAKVGHCGYAYQACCAGFAASGTPCGCHLADGDGKSAANCGTCGTAYSLCCAAYKFKGYPCTCDIGAAGLVV